MQTKALRASVVVWIRALLVLSNVGVATRVHAGEAPIEPQAGTWKTWVLASGSQFRLPPPPDKAATAAEIKQLQDMAAKRDAAALDQIAYWDTGAPSYRWNEIAINECLKHNLGHNMAARHLALVHVAIYDALVAAWDSKYTS